MIFPFFPRYFLIELPTHQLSACRSILNRSLKNLIFFLVQFNFYLTRAITLIYSKIGVYIEKLIKVVQFYCDQDLMTTSLYADSTIFNTALFKVDPETSQYCWIGLANNAPINLNTTIPTGSPYKFSVYATFGSGSAAEEQQTTATVKKNQHFLSKIPIVKTPHSIKTTNLPEEHPYVKPAVTKNEPHPIDASGNVNGSYQVHTVPWPSSWRVYLSLNLQANPTGDILQFEVAADASEVDESLYAGSFNPTEFLSTGNVIWYNITTPHKYVLSPSSNTWFPGRFN